MMPWTLSWRADPIAKRLADRHYNRQRPHSGQFVPPGRCVVLRTPAGDAVWVTSVQLPEYARHAWPGAWVNSLFRREDGAPLASELITAAVAATRYQLGDPPEQGIITFIDATKVRHKRDPGRCYRRAGWRFLGHTRDRHLLVFGQAAADIPPPEAPFGSVIGAIA